MTIWKKDKGSYKTVYIPEDSAREYDYVIKIFPWYLENIIGFEFYGYLINLKEPLVIFEDKDIRFRFARTFTILPVEYKEEGYKIFCVVQEKVKDGKKLSDEDMVYLEEKLKNSEFSWEDAYLLKFPLTKTTSKRENNDKIYFEDITPDNILKRKLKDEKEEYVIIDWMCYKVGLKRNIPSEELAKKIWYAIKPSLGYLPEHFELPEELSEHINIITL